MDKFVSLISDALYSYVLIILLVAGGIYFTVRTGFAQFRLFGAQIKAVTEKPKEGGGVSSFQALMVSTASRVGTGNIIGVASALCLGGFGSVFWMWIIAIVGSASSLIESTLAQIYKRKGADGGCYGGPAYYIETALRSRPLAIVFSVLLILTYGVGFNMLASYNLQSTFSGYGFYNSKVTPWIIGAVVAALVAYCLLGGGKRVVRATSLLVPVMGVVYVLIALLIIGLNITTIPSVFARIFKEAFDLRAIFGGFSGSCVMYGIKRGLFSNEAGVGSAPNASASAEVSHPAKQGLVQVLSVFIDTLVICSATAFMCMCSGVEPSESLNGAAYIHAALRTSLGGFGPVFITVAMVLFAFTTLLGNLYYVDKAVVHILKREPGRAAKTVYHIVCALVVLVGAGLSAGLLWNIADVLMGAMTLINLPVIVILGKWAFRAIRDYERSRKSGVEPIFHAKDIGLPHEVDFWN
jgi:AGCS family alanine or glycine:cation symporter